MRSPQPRFPAIACALAALLVAGPSVLVASGRPGQDAARARDASWQRKLDRRLREISDTAGRSPQRVIIRARRGSEARVEGLVRRKGQTRRFGLSLVGGVVAEVQPEELEALAADPDVEAISTDAVVEAHQSATDPCSTVYGWFLNDPCRKPSSQYYVLRGALGYPSSEWTGANVGVAVIDSGLAPLSDYRITHFVDFTTGKAQRRNPVDGYGHGTHVAGLIAGSGAFSSGHYQGVAPGVRLIGLRVLDNEGRGYTSNVIEAIEYAVANRAALGIDVINLSLGHPVYQSAADDPLVLAVESAVRAGIVVVASAGNMGTDPATGKVGYGGISSPGNAPSAITVGAVDLRGTAGRADDLVAPYSSRGPTWIDGFAKPDLVAPGHGLVAPVGLGATLYQLLPGLRVLTSLLDPFPHLRLSGTSMATAVTSGVVATMIQVQRAHYGRSMSPNAIKAMLQYSAIPLASEDILTQGAGSLNMGGALTLARRVNPQAGKGGWWLTSSVQPATVIDGQWLPWSQHIVWNNHIVWGDTIGYNQPAWANHIVWGDASAGWNSWTVLGKHVVWSDHSLWANHIVWGDAMLGRAEGNHIVWGDSNVDPSNVVWKPIPGGLASNSFVAGAGG